MNDLYELLIESQDVQLIVTEGIVSGSINNSYRSFIDKLLLTLFFLL